MDAQDKSQKPQIIIRKVVGGEESGHHGGAWKVAYADFVTAMMAFFLLMWLLNATTEQQRRGLADYFNPSVMRQPGASGDGIESGVRLGIDAFLPDTHVASDFDSESSEVRDRLNGLGAESMQMKNLLKHVVTRMTDEGLVIELTDLTSEPLFQPDTATPSPILGDLAAVIAAAIKGLRNQVAISGHVRSYPEVLLNTPVWDLSMARADVFRQTLQQHGFNEVRVQRVTGFADRKHYSANPMDQENNRIELILLR